MLLNKKFNLKKVISISATALALVSFGSVAVNHVNHIPATQTVVKAATVRPSDVHYDNDGAWYVISPRLYMRELYNNREAYPKIWHSYGHNSIRVHWYRHPQLRNDLPNTDSSVNNYGYEPYALQTGYAWVVGTARINGRNVYLKALNSSSVAAEDMVNINKSPRLYQAHNITLYDGTANNAGKVGRGSLAIMVPYYHRPITLPIDHTGKLQKFVPVIGNPDSTYESPYVITLSDYKKMIHQRQPRTVYMIYHHHVITAGNHGRGHINTSRIRHGYSYRKQRNGAYALTRGRHRRANQRRALRNLKRALAYAD